MHSKTGDSHADKELIARVILGDNHAFASIVRNTERLVTQIVFKMIANAEDRKDVAQDIYLKAFRKLSSFRFEARLSTWIAHIAYTTCLDQLKKKKLSLILDTDENDTDGDSAGRKMEIVDAAPDATQWLDKERAGILQAAIEKLPPLYKTLVTLYHTEELSYEEIMEITNLPAGTVKNYLFRARKQLKEILLATYKKEEL